MNSGIYKISFGSSKCYVGSAVSLQKRKNGHLSNLRRNVSHCTKLQRAFNKYGEEVFEFVVLEYCDVAQLAQKELEWIVKLDCLKSGYNIASDTKAPMLGRKHTNLTKGLMSLQARGNKSNLGRTFTIAHRNKIGSKRKGISTKSWVVRGEDGGQAKITVWDALDIIWSTETEAVLSKRYGISGGQVGKIKRREKWQHLN